MLSLRIVETIANSDSEQAKSGKQYLKHAEISQIFQKLVEPSNKQNLTKIIAECYNNRRALYYEMYDYVFGLQKSPDAEIVQAANEIFAALNLYGRYFSNIKIAEQSLRFVRIIEALKNPELSTALQKTQLTSKVNTLDGLQRDYEDVYRGRSNARLGYVSASEKRKELNAAIKLHIEELNWMATQTESEALKTLCAKLNARLGEIYVTKKPTKNENPSTDSTNAA